MDRVAPPLATSVSSFWLLWLAAAVALLMGKPWGSFGWDEWLAVAVPLMLIHPAVRRVDVLILGVSVSSLAWYLQADHSGGWSEIACLYIALFIGTYVGYAMTRRDETNTSLTATVTEQPSAGLFFDALDRELCRMRRDEGSFAVLSLALDGDEEAQDDVLDGVFEMLDTELRAYADIARIGERVLALVPDVSDKQCKPLVKRLKRKWKTTRSGKLRVGLALFPRDAICAENLIQFADHERLAIGIESVTTEPHYQPGKQVSA